MASSGKDPDALRTIGELSAELGVAQHILRYWETKFPQLRPMQRAGNRRYYRPADVQLVQRIHRLLSDEGYTVKGVQKLLRERNAEETPVAHEAGQPSPLPVTFGEAVPPIDVERVRAVRDRLADALSD